MSFFKSFTRSAAAPAPEVEPKVDADANGATPSAAKAETTSKPLLVAPSSIDLKPKTYTEEQTTMVGAAETFIMLTHTDRRAARGEPNTKQKPLHTLTLQFTKTIMLPETDEYYPWELRFLSDPGTHPRYMRAAKWKMDDAKKRIQGTIEWRREYRPEVIEPSEVSPEGESGKL